MENGSFWKFEDMKGRGRLASTGAGTLGRGIVGSCGVQSHAAACEREPAKEGLLKTLSMPMLATHGPCGGRVGEDLGMSECGTPRRPAREPRRLGAGLEDRLVHLERSFSGSQLASLASLAYPRDSKPGSRAGTGLISRGDVYTSSTNRGASRGNLSTGYSMRSALQTPNSAVDGRFRDMSTIGLNSGRLSSFGGRGSTSGSRPGSIGGLA